MKPRKIIGGILLAAPFVGIGIITVINEGWVGLLQVYGAVFGIVLLVVVGVNLLDEDTNMNL